VIARQTWTTFIRAVDPYRELQPDEIDSLYADRPQAAWSRLWDALEFSPSPERLKFLLAGSRGSGKTTELIKLQSELHERFVVLRVDIAPLHENGAGTLPIVAALGASLELAIRSWRGEEPGEARDSGVRAALQQLGVAAEQFEGLLKPLAGLVALVPTSEAAATATALATTAGAAGLSRKALVQLQGLSRGDKLASRLNADNEGAATELIEAVNQALAELHDLAGRPAMLLVDGLDKKTHLQDVLTALGDVHLLLDIQAPLVFTGPAHLRTDERFAAGNVVGFKAEVLHNITVLDHTPDGLAPKDEGLAALLSLAHKRFKQAGLPDDLVQEPALRHLARMSSGYVRDYLRLLDEAGKACRTRKGEHISLDDAQEATRQLRHGFQGAINEEDLRLLGRVLQTERLPAGERADELFFENHIACFRNHDLWYRPHEVLVDYVRKATEEPGE